MSDTNNVSTGKPKVGGAIFTAPLGTELPVDAVSELPAAYKSMGYVSDDGLTNSNSPSASNVKAWGGDIVMTTVAEKPDTFKYKLIEAMNPEVLKHIYGSDNVIGSDIESGITIKANNNLQEASVLVVDMVLRGNTLKRVVIPKAFVTAVGDIGYTDSSAIGYETTVTAIPDADGNTHYEYMQKASGTVEVDEENSDEENTSEENTDEE